MIGTEGKRLGGVPRNSGSLWTTYEFQNGSPLKGLKVGAGAVARDLAQGDNYNDFQLPGYATVNMMAAYETKAFGKKTTFQVNLNNLLDTRYYGEAYPSNFSIDQRASAIGSRLRQGRVLTMVRRVFVWLHRWVGLAMAGFLILVGLTGSLLAFNTELERIFAPQLFAKPRPGVAQLDLATLAERGEKLVPLGRLVYVAYTQPDQVRLWFEPREDTESASPMTSASPISMSTRGPAKSLGRRGNADLSQGLINLMPFIYDLHWRLALGDLGQWTLGILALIWTIDCFVGFYLTLPHTTVAFWRRWKLCLAHQEERGLLPAEFRFASRGRPLALGDAVRFRLVQRDDGYAAAGLRMGDGVAFRLHLAHRRFRRCCRNGRPKTAARLARGASGRRKLLADQASKHGFTTSQPISLQYVYESNVYFYEARGSQDVVDRFKIRRRHVRHLRRRQRGVDGADTAERRPTGKHDRKLALRAAYGAGVRPALSHLCLRARSRRRHALRDWRLYLVEEARARGFHARREETRRDPGTVTACRLMADAVKEQFGSCVAPRSRVCHGWRRRPCLALFAPRSRRRRRPAGSDSRKRQRPVDAQNLGKDISGVFVESPVAQGGYAPDFMFRGFDNGGVILRDGVARGFATGNVELAGVERTEFVKGVASMLYGATTAANGAAANYILKKPEPDFFLHGDASLGGYAYRRVTIDLNMPLNDEKNLLFRLNAAIQESQRALSIMCIVTACISIRR